MGSMAFGSSGPTGQKFQPPQRVSNPLPYDPGFANGGPFGKNTGSSLPGYGQHDNPFLDSGTPQYGLGQSATGGTMNPGGGTGSMPTLRDVSSMNDYYGSLPIGSDGNYIMPNGPTGQHIALLAKPNPNYYNAQQGLGSGQPPGAQAQPQMAMPSNMGIPGGLGSIGTYLAAQNRVVFPGGYGAPPGTPGGAPIGSGPWNWPTGPNGQPTNPLTYQTNWAQQSRTMGPGGTSPGLGSTGPRFGGQPLLGNYLANGPTNNPYGTTFGGIPGTPGSSFMGQPYQPAGPGQFQYGRLPGGA